MMLRRRLEVFTWYLYSLQYWVTLSQSTPILIASSTCAIGRRSCLSPILKSSTKKVNFDYPGCFLTTCLASQDFNMVLVFSKLHKKHSAGDEPK